MANNNEDDLQVDLKDAGVNKNGFSDQNSAYPKSEYIDAPSTNQAARGNKKNRVYLGVEIIIYH